MGVEEQMSVWGKIGSKRPVSAWLRVPLRIKQQQEGVRVDTCGASTTEPLEKERERERERERV